MEPFNQYWESRREANQETLKLEKGKPCPVEPRASISFDTKRATHIRIPLLAKGRNWGISGKVRGDQFVEGKLTSCRPDGTDPKIHGSFEVDEGLFNDLVQKPDMIVIDTLLRRIAEEGGNV